MPSSQSDQEERPWYSEGLHFHCTACGDCCTGAPGYVWLNREDIALLAQETDLTIKDFERKFVRQVGIRKSLIEFDNGDCVLFDPKSRKCSVYEGRPRQCRTWPFWESNLRTPETWRATCEACPGSGHGKLYTLEKIETARTRVRV